MGKPNENGLFMDSIASFESGMNSDVPPIALQKNQLSFATNATLRGNYFTPRSSYQDVSLSFTTSTVQTNFESSLWQGVTYYKPDSGSECLIVSVGGRIFRVTPSESGYTATVEDITPSAGAASSSAPIAWLWQSEKWVIRNDGQSSPMLFDGNSSRYADTGTVVGTTNAAFTVPSVGSTIAVTLASAFTGVFGSTVNVKSGGNLVGQFQVAEQAAGSQVRLVNFGDAEGSSHSSGETVQVVNNWTGVVIGDFPGNASINSQSSGSVNPPYLSSPGTQIKFSGINQTFTVVTFSGPGITTQSTGGFSHPAVATGVTVSKLSPSANITLGTILSGFTAPAVGQSVTVPFSGTYSGADGQYVSVGGTSYRIYAVPPTPGAITVYLTNINSSVTGSIASGATLESLAEIPVGRMGVYGLGRNWFCLADGISYMASDIVGSSSGTFANNFRDAVLNVTENNFLAGGGVFRVPSAGQQINAMRFPATLDSSLGQGPLQVLTQSTTFSCNAPVQRSAWQDLTNPIQTQSLVGGGALSQNSTVAVNGDLFFRSLDGIRSLRLARQDFQTSYSNTPQSVEMNRVILEDDRSLLGYSSAIVFDNRLLMTASPVQSQGGVYHSKLIALNLDPNSSLRVKQPPIYDGAWEGINVLQLITGTFSGIERAFAFTYDTDTAKIGMTEILPTSTTNLFDNGDERIVASFESPALFYQPDTASRQLLRLNDGEIIVKDISGDVRFDVYYRPDYDSTWRSWHSWEVADSPNYQPRMGLGQPDLKVGDAATGRPFAVGYSFQVKVVVTGSCVVMGMNFYAVGQPTPQFAKPLKALTPLAT